MQAYCILFFRILNVGYLSGRASSWKLFMPAQLGVCFRRHGNGFVSSCAITSLVYPITPTTSQGNGIEQTSATKNRSVRYDKLLKMKMADSDEHVKIFSREINRWVGLDSGNRTFIGLPSLTFHGKTCQYVANL